VQVFNKPDFESNREKKWYAQSV